jgi:hypothetical protein
VTCFSALGITQTPRYGWRKDQKRSQSAISFGSTQVAFGFRTGFVSLLFGATSMSSFRRNSALTALVNPVPTLPT